MNSETLRLRAWQFTALAFAILLLVFAWQFQDMKIEYKKNFDYAECAAYMTNWQLNKSFINRTEYLNITYNINSSK